MHRATPLMTSFRSYTAGGARTVIDQADDSKMMQEMGGNFMKNETRSKVESPQNYGFSSVVRQATKDGQGKISQGAEGFITFCGGNRSFPVCSIMDDRRHRPMGMKPGENAQYDDLGQMTLLRRTGVYLLTNDNAEESDQQSGGGGQSAGGQAAASGGQGQSTERFVSLRHVEKQKQQRPSSSGSGQGGGAGASTTAASSGSSSGGGQQDFKHEGQSVNLEVRVSKKRIEFRSGDTVVGYYDKQSSTWVFIGKVKLGTESASHPVYGVNNGVGMTTNPNGSDAVLVNAPEPGPPTSEDAQP